MADPTGSPASEPPVPRLPPVFRTLAALLVLDLLVGVWLALHTDKAVEIFLSQVPVLGAAGVAWGFLPKDPKDAFGAWLEANLGRRQVFLAVLVVGILFVGLTMVRSSVGINSAGDVSEILYLSTGGEYRANPSQPAPTVSHRLNRLTAPVHFSLWIPPYGRSVWLHSTRMVTRRRVRVWPWTPSNLEYPDDFEPMVAISILPGEPHFSTLAMQPRTLILRGTDGDTLAIVTMNSPEGSLVAYDSLPLDLAPLQARWDTLLIGDEGRDLIKGQWSKMRTVLGRRPVRPGERITWELVPIQGDTRPYAGVLEVHDVITDLYLTN